jgi:hypothetical protein
LLLFPKQYGCATKNEMGKSVGKKNMFRKNKWHPNKVVTVKTNGDFTG